MKLIIFWCLLSVMVSFEKGRLKKEKGRLKMEKSRKEKGREVGD